MNRDISILNRYICIKWVKPKMDCHMYVSVLSRFGLLSYNWLFVMAPCRFGPFSISEHLLLSRLSNYPTFRTIPHLIISNGHILPTLPRCTLAHHLSKSSFDNVPNRQMPLRRSDIYMFGLISVLRILNTF